MNTVLLLGTERYVCLLTMWPVFYSVHVIMASCIVILPLYVTSQASSFSHLLLCLTYFALYIHVNHALKRTKVHCPHWKNYKFSWGDMLSSMWHFLDDDPFHTEVRSIQDFRKRNWWRCKYQWSSACSANTQQGQTQVCASQVILSTSYWDCSKLSTRSKLKLPSINIKERVSGLFPEWTAHIYTQLQGPAVSGAIVWSARFEPKEILLFFSG